MDRSSSDQPLISTVVLNWNRADLLERTVTSYLATVEVPHELIIVDNGSSDDSPAVIAGLSAANSNCHALMLAENIGGEALNAGLAQGRGQYLHVSENDIEYRAGWDRAMLAKFEAFPELGQLSPFSPFPDTLAADIIGNRPATRLERNGQIIYVAHDNTTSTCVFPRDLWEQGLRWTSLVSGDRRFPHDGAFSAEVKRRGRLVAFSDVYLVKNWGHDIDELSSRLDYYLDNYRAKSWLGIDGLRSRLREHGYDLEEGAEAFRIASCPLPDPGKKGRTISCRALGELDGTVFWSRVVDCGSFVLKHATNDLAAREGRLLASLADDPHFPECLGVTRGDGWSAIEVERVEGEPLEVSMRELDGPAAFRSLFLDALAILEALEERKIVHRDIRPENLVVRDGHLVLLDFGWATSPIELCHAPSTLGGDYRAPHGPHNDVYSMGQLLKIANGGRYSEFLPITALMSEKDSSMRVTDLRTLRVLLAESVPLLDRLLEATATRRRLLAEREKSEWNSRMRAVKAELDALIPEGAAIALVDDGNWRAAEHRFAGRTAWGFNERDGVYWGPPLDDDNAIREVIHLRSSGVQFLVFGWPAFWWLDYYAGLRSHLEASYYRLLENDRLVVYDLADREAS